MHFKIKKQMMRLEETSLSKKVNGSSREHILTSNQSLNLELKLIWMVQRR